MTCVSEVEWSVHDDLCVSEVEWSVHDDLFCVSVVDWEVLITTGSEEEAGTDSKVTLTVFGDKGNSGPQLLELPNGKFNVGQTDSFSVSCLHFEGNINVPHSVVYTCCVVRGPMESEGRKNQVGWTL